MKRLLKHRGYSVFVQPVGLQLLAVIQRPGTGVTICEVPAVSAKHGEAALKPLAKAAIERDLQRS